MCFVLQVFQDIGDQYLVDKDLITRGRFLGKGAFGAVFAGQMTREVREMLGFSNIFSCFIDNKI